MAAERVKLTTERIERATCPPGKLQLLLWDDEQPGLALRVRSGGSKSFVVTYRPGAGGRKEPKRWVTLGQAGKMSVKAAREAARRILGQVANSRDPAAEQAEERRRERAVVAAALDAYERNLTGRGVVNRKLIMSLLRRELKPLATVDLATLARRQVVDRIEAIEAEGLPGKAKDFRAKVAVFLNWAVNAGLMPVSPLSGLRRQRATKLQRLARPGRALTDAELPPLWRAVEAVPDPFLRAYLMTLILTGQRRTETALMRWSQLDLTAGLWTIPAEITKAGREHVVPVPAELLAILAELPRMRATDLVFPGRNMKPMSGWTQRLAPVMRAAGLEKWTLHDLRRTVRSGLGRLGVDAVIAEMMLNHEIGDELRRIYDREEYRAGRTEAAARWARHVLGLVNPSPHNVIEIRMATAI